MNRLIIIDGNAVLHRAFHAIPPLTDRSGRVVNAVYGFTAMLLKLVTDFTPANLAVVFDRPAPTFRKKLFADYQSKRPKMDETLVPQIQIVHDVVTALRVPIFEKDGFEADDVIGTIIERVKGQGTGDKKTEINQVIIVTGDRDILQLVKDETVLVYMPIKGLNEAKLYGEKDVFERLGVMPNKITDYKGLAGDSSDNYPGVAGIGPKTAVSLLKTYGSVEGLYASLDKGTVAGISTNVIEKLTLGKENAFLSKDLATIRQEVPISIDWESMKVKDLNNEESRKILFDLSFHTLLRRLEGKEKEEKKEKEKKEKKKKPESNVEQLTLV